MVRGIQAPPRPIHYWGAKVMGATMWCWIFWRLKHDWRDVFVSLFFFFFDVLTTIVYGPPTPGTSWYARATATKIHQVICVNCPRNKFSLVHIIRTRNVKILCNQHHTHVYTQFHTTDERFPNRQQPRILVILLKVSLSLSLTHSHLIHNMYHMVCMYMHNVISPKKSAISYCNGRKSRLVTGLTREFTLAAAGAVSAPCWPTVWESWFF